MARASLWNSALRLAAACAGLLAAAGHAAGEAPLKKVKVGVFGTVCEAPLFAAYEKGFFKARVDAARTLEEVHGTPFLSLPLPIGPGAVDAFVRE